MGSGPFNSQVRKQLDRSCQGAESIVNQVMMQAKPTTMSLAILLVAGVI